jgi:pimeloyl-ACP methyl ester carboxylesterase
MSVLLSPLPTDQRSFIDWNILMYTKTGAKTPPPDVDWIRRRAEKTWNQGWTVAGFLRHLLAVISATNRKPLVRALRIPVSVVQGDADPIFGAVSARELTDAIPGAQLRMIPGMGHDIPSPFWPAILDAVDSARAR